jgi:hypothetical protein
MSTKASNQFFVPHNVLEEQKFISMSLSAQMLYIHLCRIKNRMRKNKFFRDINTLSRETGMHRNTICKAKKELIKSQYIGVERDCYKSSGNRSADVFHLNGYRYKCNLIT